MTRRNPFPGVTRAPDRHGKVRWRCRMRGRGMYLPGAYGSAEFRAAYEAFVAGTRTPVERAGGAAGSIAWLVTHYLRQPAFVRLSAGRQKALRSILDWIRIEAGDLPATRFAARHVEALMDRKGGASAANAVKKAMSQLFNHAIRNELAGVTVNPAEHAARREENADGFHTWTEAEIGRFLDRHGPGTTARRALMLILCTGAARQDVARMGWQNVKAGRIAYRRGKTGLEADLPILPELAAELVHVRAADLLFITWTKGGMARGYTAESFGNWFRDRCTEAGLPHCSAHGLRKAGATRLANHGATEWEVMAFLAHKTPKMAATYTKAAGRVRLADSGMAKLAGTKPEGNVSNLSERLDKGAS